MEYINIHRSILDGAEFVGAEPVDRATWLSLLSFCCGQENGGVIEECAKWSDRKWQQMAKVTQAEVQRTTDLWKWAGEDLEVNFYPVQAEKETRAKRRGGAIGNRRRWSKKGRTESQSESDSDSGSDAASESLTESITKRNETEGNETEAPRVVTLAQAILWMDANASGYSHDQIREQWLYYDAVRDPESGLWRKPLRTGAFAQVTDWRSELCAALARFGEKEAAPLNPSVQAYTNNKRRAELMAELQELEEEIESRHQAGAEIPGEKKAREREIRKELAA